MVQRSWGRWHQLHWTRPGLNGNMFRSTPGRFAKISTASESASRYRDVAVPSSCAKIGHHIAGAENSFVPTEETAHTNLKLVGCKIFQAL